MKSRVVADEWKKVSCERDSQLSVDSIQLIWTMDPQLAFNSSCRCSTLGGLCPAPRSIQSSQENSWHFFRSTLEVFRKGNIRGVFARGRKPLTEVQGVLSTIFAGR